MGSTAPGALKLHTPSQVFTDLGEFFRVNALHILLILRKAPFRNGDSCPTYQIEEISQVVQGIEPKGKNFPGNI